MIIVTVAGRLGRDSELRQAGSSQVLGFSLAGDTGFGDRKQSHWFNCSIWGNQGVALQQYLKKGNQVTVIGEFSEREHEGKFYKELRVNSIELQGGGQAQQQDQQQQQNYQNQQQNNPQTRQPAPQPAQQGYQNNGNPQPQNNQPKAMYNEHGEEIDENGNVKDPIPF